MEPITFLATIPQIQSAIKVGGDGSTRLQLDIPTTELPQMLKLVAYGPGKVLRVSVGVDGEV